MTILETQNLWLYAFEQNPADDVQALFQIPKHWRYKGVKPSLTPFEPSKQEFLFYPKKKPLFLNPWAGQCSVNMIEHSELIRSVHLWVQQWLSFNRFKMTKSRWLTFTYQDKDTTMAILQKVEESRSCNGYPSSISSVHQRRTIFQWVSLAHQEVSKMMIPKW